MANSPRQTPELATRECLMVLYLPLEVPQQSFAVHVFVLTGH